MLGGRIMKFYKIATISILNIFILTGCRYFGPCSNLEISVEQNVMAVGETQELFFTTNCESETPTINWYVDNTSIISCEETTFMITALAVGETYITANLDDYPTYSNSLTITVVQNQ